MPIETAFVPDATRGSHHLETRTPPPPIETAFVADATYGPSPLRAVPKPTPARWKPWAIAGGLALVIVIAIAAAAGGNKSKAVGAGTATILPDGRTAPEPPDVAPDAATAPEPPELEDPPPGQIRAFTPPMTDQRAADDWTKVIDELYEHKYREARKKLDEWERRWRASRETRSLRRQLDALPAEHFEDD